MKKVVSFSLIFLTSACSPSVRQIGKLNMISNRNVDPTLKYQVLATYSGGGQRDLRKSRALTVEDAIDQTVRRVPGGEFLMNAKVYIVNGTFFAVEGDVWGSSAQSSYKGFKVGDKVTWKVKGMMNATFPFKQGTITAFKDNQSCYVKADSPPNKIIELLYDDITKVGN